MYLLRKVFRSKCSSTVVQQKHAQHGRRPHVRAEAFLGPYGSEGLVKVARKHCMSMFGLNMVNVQHVPLEFGQHPGGPCTCFDTFRAEALDPR